MADNVDGPEQCKTPDWECTEEEDDQDGDEDKWTNILRTICSLIFFLGTMSCAFFSKTSILIMISFSAMVEDDVSKRGLALLLVVFALISNNVVLFIKSIWKVIFDKEEQQQWTFVFKVCLAECISSALATLTVLLMSYQNIITNALLLNAVTFFPCLLSLISSCVQRVGYKMQQAKSRANLTNAVNMYEVTGEESFVDQGPAEAIILTPQPKSHTWEIVTTSIALILIIGGFVIFTLGLRLGWTPESPGLRKQDVLLIVMLILTSTTWWENFVMGTITIGSVKVNFSEFKAKIKKSRFSLYAFSIPTRMATALIVFLVFIVVDSGGQFGKTFMEMHQHIKILQILLPLVIIHAGCSLLCYWFGIVGCQINCQNRCFSMPLTLITPVTVSILLAFFYIRTNENICRGNGNDGGAKECKAVLNLVNLTNVEQMASWFCYDMCRFNHRPSDFFTYLSSSGVCWQLAIILFTLYTWQGKQKRIMRTGQLFLRRLHYGAFLEQSLLMSRRKDSDEHELSRTRKMYTQANILLCATMWHETPDEMKKILQSIYRLDEHRSSNQSVYKMEAHVYFDDAFVNGRINQYVCYLLETLSVVDKENNADRPDIMKQRMKKFITPYGMQLIFSLPFGCELVIHLKDKTLVRRKKRWSQVMYMFYLIGWKSRNNVEDRDHTYLLALDGDTDFKPGALMMLLDRLQRDDTVAAACGRIHPTGNGPLVWYQKFEYAVGHWLQKSAEHVFGCVLCVPGCFSLFRASALMHRNVAGKYTANSLEAKHLVQYDQGEDRWLSTLLLQHGYRLEYCAGADAHTNAPEGFSEFFNQRRRWGPSTMANSVDLLQSSSETVKRNQSISRAFVFYMHLNMVSSLLGPATVCLMLAGAITYIFHIESGLAIIVSVIPQVLFLIICFKCKAATQIKIAGFLSVIYALMMTGTLFSVIGEMVRAQSIFTPVGLFTIVVAAIFIITAILHPKEFSCLIYGMLYYLCIPTGYLVLIIYSLVNMYDTSWGTRDSEVSSTEQVSKFKLKGGRPASWSYSCCGVNFGVASDAEENEATIPLAPTKDVVIEEVDQVQLKILEMVNKCKVDPLTQREARFWKEFVVKYLMPNELPPTQKVKMMQDLKELRNKVVLLFCMCNSLWIVATLFLQLSAPDLSLNWKLHGSTLKVEPLTVMFLISFGTMQVVQFFAMIYHRFETLLHILSYKERRIKDTLKDRAGRLFRRVSNLMDAESIFRMSNSTLSLPQM
uniref:chitin synthase chs-2-like n=1 Tax=Myxine glutinosa TaxID=7769 RepID=UPI00358F3451